MKYASVLILFCSMPFMACGNSMDDFLEDISEPESVKMYYTDTLTVAHWNIGHFAMGRANNTTISIEDSESMASEYRSLIDSIDADIFGVCEYNSTFSLGGEKTSSYIFCSYPNSIIGSQLSYNCNAIFSRTLLTESKVFFFERCVQQRYYVVSKLPINGHEVIFVETHLDWDQSVDGKGCRASQIQALVETLKGYEYVIICADYNVSDVNEFLAFINAGFSLASGDDFGLFPTYPTFNPLSVYDNIIVKGFFINNVSVINYKHLSDHCIIKCDLVFNDY